jgi:hypothetical protein
MVIGEGRAEMSDDPKKSDDPKNAASNEALDLDFELPRIVAGSFVRETVRTKRD